jgi:integrase
MSGKKIKTNSPGVRYREHPSRKYRSGLDRYYSIRYRVDGRSVEEGLGWSSEGITASEASETLAGLKKAIRTGEGPKTLSEKRRNQKDQEETRAKDEELNKMQMATFSDIWKEYIEIAKQNKKATTCNSEKGLYKNWLQPAIGDKPLLKISQIDLERLNAKMQTSKRSPRTREYALALIRQIFNFANKYKNMNVSSPINDFRKIKINNARDRALTILETNSLLEKLRAKSQVTYEMAFLSLHNGLRAGEIFNLQWTNVDFENDLLKINDAKGNKNRKVPINKTVKEMLKNKLATRNEESQFVFSYYGNKKIKYLSKAFANTVKELGFNKGIIDRRERIVFHSLRHTCASLLAQGGCDLYAISKLLGHSSIKLTERYSHLSDDYLKEQAKVIEEAFSENKSKDTRVVDLK